MLRIAVIGNTYPEVKNFINYRFQDHVKSINQVRGIWTLHNGDELHMCYDETGKDKFLSMMYDAFIITPTYVSLVDIIRHRTERR